MEIPAPIINNLISDSSAFPAGTKQVIISDAIGDKISKTRTTISQKVHFLRITKLTYFKIIIFCYPQTHILTMDLSPNIPHQQQW